MNMSTSSSATCYSHPLVTVPQVELRMDYGWYGHILHDCSTEKMRIQRIKMPRFNKRQENRILNKSVQATWITNSLKKMDAKDFPSIQTYLGAFEKLRGWFFPDTFANSKEDTL